MMKKDYFKQKLLLWPLVSFDHFEVSASPNLHVYFDP